MRKPRLTARVVRGLESCYSLLDVNRDMGDDSELYAGCRVDNPKPPKIDENGDTVYPDNYDKKKVDEVNDAIEWIGRLIDWHRASLKGCQKP